MRYDKLREFAGKYKYLFIVAAVGLALLIMPSFGGEAEPSPPPESDAFDVSAVEQRIGEALSCIDGVGKAEVVLSPDRTMQSRYHADTKNGDAATVVVQAGSGTQEAVVETRIYPLYRGALVVCEGGGLPSVRLEVTRAVAALTGLTADKIVVQKLG